MLKRFSAMPNCPVRIRTGQNPYQVGQSKLKPGAMLPERQEHENSQDRETCRGAIPLRAFRTATVSSSSYCDFSSASRDAPYRARKSAAKMASRPSATAARSPAIRSW